MTLEDQIKDIVGCIETEVFFNTGVAYDCKTPTPFVRYFELSCDEYEKPVNGSNKTRTYERIRFRLDLYTNAAPGCNMSNALEESKEEISKLRELGEAIQAALFSGKYGAVSNNGRVFRYKRISGLGGSISKRAYPIASQDCQFLKLELTQTVEYRKGCKPCLSVLYFSKDKFQTSNKKFISASKK